MGPKRALVLAGSRGATDPVALAAGHPHKALVPVLGVPMLLRVVRTLLASPGIERITLCIDKGLKSHGLGAELEGLIRQGIVDLAEPEASPSLSVAHVIERTASAGRGELWPLLVTTADHPLLTPAMVRHFCEATPDDADFTIGLAEASVILKHHPDAIRTFYRFAGKGYSGCNLFMLATPKARRLVMFWQEMERHRKRPWRLIAAVGVSVLCRFLIGRLTLDDALDHLSRRLGARIEAVTLPFAEAAIDVDKPADLALAEAILRGRG